MKAKDIQTRVTELFGDKVIAFNKNDERLFQTSDHEVTGMFWLHYRRGKLYVETAMAVELLKSKQEEWLAAWNERIDYLFDAVRRNECENQS